MDLSIKLNYNSLELMSKYCLLTFPLSLKHSFFFSLTKCRCV